MDLDAWFPEIKLELRRKKTVVAVCLTGTLVKYDFSNFYQNLNVVILILVFCNNYIIPCCSEFS